MNKILVRIIFLTIYDIKIPYWQNQKRISLKSKLTITIIKMINVFPMLSNRTVKGKEIIIIKPLRSHNKNIIRFYYISTTLNPKLEYHCILCKKFIRKGLLILISKGRAYIARKAHTVGRIYKKISKFVIKQTK